MSRGVQVVPHDAYEDVDSQGMRSCGARKIKGLITGSSSCETVDNARSVGIETHNLVSVAQLEDVCRDGARKGDGRQATVFKRKPLSTPLALLPLPERVRAPPITLAPAIPALEAS